MLSLMLTLTRMLTLMMMLLLTTTIIIIVVNLLNNDTIISVDGLCSVFADEWWLLLLVLWIMIDICFHADVFMVLMLLLLSWW